MFQPTDLSQFSTEELRKFVHSFDTVLCDCDGVLFLLVTPIDGASDSLKKLKSFGKHVRYVTNNCSKSKKIFTEQMLQMGFDLKEEEIIMPTVAIVDYLKGIKFDKKLFVLSFQGMKKDLMDAGFKLADTGPSEVTEDTKIVMSTLFDMDPDVGAIIIDVDVNINFIKLQKAVLYLRNPETYFFVAAGDSMIPVGKNVHLIGPRHFQNAVRTVSGRDPVEFGKPSQNLIDYVNKTFKVDPNMTLFIGDTFSDMMFASDAGYQKLLVFTGTANKKNLEDCVDPKLLPNYYLNSLGDLNGLLDQIPKEINSSL